MTRHRTKVSDLNYVTVIMSETTKVKPLRGASSATTPTVSRRAASIGAHIVSSAGLGSCGVAIQLGLV